MRSSRPKSGWVVWTGSAFVLAVGLAGILMLRGCSPQGVGSVNWGDNPNARAPGARPSLPDKPDQPPARPSLKKSEFFVY
jgi:hypothetical protein